MSGRSEDPSTSTSISPWKRFWERGGWWKATLLVVVYYALYQLGGFLFVPFRGDPAPGSASALLFDYILPIAFGGALLVAFALSLGWLRELFARQPINGRGWMWIGVAVVLVFNVLRFASLDYAAAGFDVVAAWLVAGLCIGFAEEVLTRGYVVNLMRKAGHSELATALVSAALFAGLHSGNLLGGQSLLATGIQVVYTFAFGICMYLTLRVTGHLIWPILLHASTDPSIFLLTTHPGDGPLATFAGFGNIPVILFGLVAIIFIRGRVTPPAVPGLPEGAPRD
ncbi:CPBP family intramembrane glutamic endopeptidase [Pseudoclavibacter sp. VKM Ac-2888]|uniref:CPBP family intramembrane glutamic endopeptidase n=1 Tax=Pseudoclavibacter sp. VKM Ac-2888 TaxID=2783830 RepID=UPI00188AEE38|nr:CPBP family intramembrane glutamic endopeptidase [Pseudoclavibacter sp. VKM Ac-2888]MBF4550265.1 CPBP family intramembrane metalloprotease [Pseudoclavibacter sp. VKM Ac-2888]